MKCSLVLLLIFALSVQVNCLISASANPLILNRVINGHPGTPGSAPYHAHILIRQNQDDGARVGSGCLISMTHVLTTAQNVRTFSHWEIGVGNVERDRLEWREATQALAHPLFDHNTLNNNIAIITVMQPFIAGFFVEAISMPLPTDIQVPFPNAHCRFDGFGFTGPTGPFSDQLLMGIKHVTTDQVCAQTYPHIAHSLVNNFCAQGLQFESTFCQGDQGTALVSMVRFRLVVVGLASFTDGRCQGNIPGVFVRVTAYRNWIQQNTGL
ncbi:chymotrypsin B-like [Phlebotomus argentipes]|uniref:chymotrypsin B-like n=1 Tax=Phlebotomus argentipes TaxID=94469 RepID=UPI0028933C18|nr:chymotrypsin B-like [Phlebotomus argentipes]